MAESTWHSIEIETIIRDLDTDHHHSLSEEEAIENELVFIGLVE